MAFALLGDYVVGGIKIKDGLFIGDQYAAQVDFYDEGRRVHIYQQDKSHSELFASGDTELL
jgi:hypothetical protein